MKIWLISADVSYILQIPELEFEIVVSEKTGLISSKHVAVYHNCKIVVHDSGKVFFLGSIHKLWNSINGIKAPNYNKIKQYKGFNGNQFMLINIFEVRKHLENLFKISSEKMLFQNIELGMNTTPGFCSTIFMKGLLYHKNILFEYRFNGNFAQAKHQTFIFKIYNKSYQYDMDGNVLRIELKIIKTSELKPVGLRTFYDVNEETMLKAKGLLLKRFDEVLNYDYTIRRKALSTKEKNFLKSYSNPRYWIDDLKPNHRDRHKKRLLKIILENSDNLHQQLRKDIIKKCVMFIQQFETAKCVMITTSSIGINITQNTVKKCPITGLDLKHENKDAKYIRTTTLRFLYQNDKTAFSQLCSMLLSKSLKRPKYENSLINHLAKQIRNRYYNPMPTKQIGYNQKIYINQFSLSI